MAEAVGTRSRRSVLVVAAVSALLLAGCAPSPTRGPTATPVHRAAASPVRQLRLPASPRIYFFGDSWTQGVSADAGRGFVPVAAAALGATVVRSPTGSGTGFVHVYPRAGEDRVPYPRRARTVPAFEADAIVVQGGINDVGHDLTGYPDAIDRTVSTLRKKAGGTVPVVVVGPAPFTFPVSTSARSVDRFLAAGAARDRYLYVSPLQEHWLTRRNAGWFIDPVTRHPNTAGHAYLGGRLAASIRSLEGLAP